MRAAVIGAGIGGLETAIALERAGVEPKDAVGALSSVIAEAGADRWRRRSVLEA